MHQLSFRSTKHRTLTDSVTRVKARGLSTFHLLLSHSYMSSCDGCSRHYPYMHWSLASRISSNPAYVNDMTKEELTL